MNRDIDKFFDLFHLGITKSYEEILEDNKFCSVMRERLKWLCLEHGYSFKWLNDNFGLAYKVCGILHLSLFGEYLYENTLILYKRLEKYCIVKFSPSDDDEIILRSLIFLILSKNIKPLNGSEDTIDYILDCIAKQNRNFAKGVLVFSKEDSQKYSFNFGVKLTGRSAWRDHGGFEYVFRNVVNFHNNAMDRMYKHFVCLWSLDERLKIVDYIREYFTYSSSFWDQYKGYEYKDNIKQEINQGMEYLRNLVCESLNQEDEIEEFIKNGVNNSKHIKEENKNLDKSSVRTKPVVKVSSGRPPEPLFKNKEGKKDIEKTQECAELFIEFLKKHHSSQIKINACKDNYITMAFIVFYRRWKGKETPNGPACRRFLLEDCALKMDDNCIESTYDNKIRYMINSVKKEDIQIMEGHVEKFFKLQKK